MPDVAKAMSGKHKPVLLHESIESLNLKAGKVFLDGTYGSGGHSREIKKRYPGLEIISIDQDPKAGVTTLNFKNLDQIVSGKLDAILFDLGISSDQLDSAGPSSGSAGRGFSFLRDEPLDMRMSGKGISAKDILNSWDEHAIELILRGFGEEKNSRKIAQRIVERRKVKPFNTTFDLVEVVGKKLGKIHPATKTFQAIRIAVNEELSALEAGLEKGFDTLESGGRFAVISFHSLEDRIVKNFFRNQIRSGKARGVTRKPIIPSTGEIKLNSRSRSAKLRVIEKI